MLDYSIYVKGLEFQQALMIEIFKDILKHDLFFHFIYEGPYVALRVDDRFEKKVTKYLNNLDMAFDVRPYEDSSYVVKKWQSVFNSLFHEFSLMSLTISMGKETTKFSELEELYERICHLFYTINTPNFVNALPIQDLSEPEIEPTVISRVALGRAFYNGGRRFAELHNDK